jgi:hypothetical protein
MLSMTMRASFHLPPNVGSPDVRTEIDGETVGFARYWSRVNGQQDLPVGGHESCPLVATRTAR